MAYKFCSILFLILLFNFVIASDDLKSNREKVMQDTKAEGKEEANSHISLTAVVKLVLDQLQREFNSGDLTSGLALHNFIECCKDRRPISHQPSLKKLQAFGLINDENKVHAAYANACIKSGLFS